MTQATQADSVAVVTGAGSPSGNGFATALRLAAAGAQIVVTDIDARAEERARDLRTRGAVARGYACDLATRGQVEAFVNAVMRDFGAIDVLVNNARASTSPRRARVA